MLNSRLRILLISLAMFAPQLAYAQVAPGTPSFGSFSGGPDIVDLANLNAHLTIPVLHKSGRGTNFTYDLSYDTSVWYPLTSGTTKSWQPVTNWGWRGQTEMATGYVSFQENIIKTRCNAGAGQHGFETTTTFFKWFYHDPFGVAHPFDVISDSIQDDCDPANNEHVNDSGVATDGSGYTISVTWNGHVTSLISAQGANIVAPLSQTTGSASATDRNGNVVSVDTSGHFFDTFSSTTPVLTVAGTGTPASPMTFTYSAPGGSALYTIKYTAYTVQTAFGCSGIAEYGPTATNLVSEIDLPDYNASSNPNSKYSFTYETTPGLTGKITGRLASVTLPTGGTISYTYLDGSSGHITCADGTAATLSRQTPDGTWNYAQAKGSGAASTTTVTDPAANVTVLQFQGIYETQRDVYQGSVSSSNLLQTIKTCYNGNTTNCPTTAITVPITQRNVTTILSGGLQSEHDDFWNTYGAPTETDDYDYGTPPHGSLLKKVVATYATLGNINAFRQSVTIQNGSGAAVSKVNYNYDETAPTITSSIPQHVSVTGPRGNLTSVNTYKNSTAFLTRRSTYYDTGTVSTTTDVNNAVTTYNYAAGTPSCYNTFPTSTTEAISGLSTSATWNCTGGVQLTSVDENNKTTTTSYTDPYFWRPASVTDPAGAVTSYCYGLMSSGSCSLNPNQAETLMTFNSGASTQDSLTTLDGLGRPHVAQTRQGPSSSSFDSVETDYDSLGRASRVTVAYSGTAGQTNSTAPATTTTYDALDRPLSVTDGGGGTTTYSYGSPGSQNNDMLVTRGPAPTGEIVKSRQFENDALGRLTSVCEITAGTTAWPGGSCAQNTAKTGYWTEYSYDPMGNLLGVTQNAQMSGSTQSRSVVYDWMSRMTSETNPESGTTTYVYDSVPAGCWNYGDNQTGNLESKTDANGNTTCNHFDALHRLSDVGSPSGCKRFRYDNTTGFWGSIPTGVTVNNPLGRLAEAETDTCGGTMVTDQWFSYTPRGETSDAYEWTVHSGLYYHASEQYWENRLPKQLAGLSGLPTISYTADPKGRINSVSASSGQNPVSSTTYNAANMPSTINLGSGSGDTDSYTYDPNTFRMTQYKFTVNSTSLTAALGWNANATVQTQNIVDGFNAPDTQNCSYAYDDITRLTTANCGSAASQSFAYDPFGNLNKSGSPYSFQPTYSTSTNRMTLIGSFTPLYDNDGNVLNDNFHTYTWDADGRPLSIDSGLSGAVSLTYDAMGRMVEQNRGGTYTEIVYSPAGRKLALMNASTLQKAMVPLSGNAIAVYNSAGLLYYAHPDLLGSIRLATTPARGLYFDTAYAPFGETYASTGTLDPAYTGQMNDTSHRQDTAGGLYDFPAREYSTQGRWPSPDPVGNAATCIKNPQTQNRYGYVANNPMSYTDPLGTFGIRRAPPPDGGCDPFIDPDGCLPIPCDPFIDPFCIGGCDPTVNPFCGIGGGPIFGGGGGGGGRIERPRPFPWPLLPPGFFGSFANDPNKVRALADEFLKPCGCHQNFADPSDCQSCCLKSTLAKQAACVAIGLGTDTEPLIGPCLSIAKTWGYACLKCCGGFPPSH